jgi:hypothetical protein
MTVGVDVATAAVADPTGVFSGAEVLAESLHPTNKREQRMGIKIFIEILLKGLGYFSKS